jgi:hypothetical protein
MLTTMRYAIVAGLMLAASCSPPSANDLEVSPSIEGQNMMVSDVALGAKLEGSFTLALSLVRDADALPLVSPLPLGAGAITSKHVGIGNVEKIIYTVDGSQPISADLKTKICSAGPVRIIGTIFDGSRGKTTPVESSPFTVSGCK